MPVIGLFTFPKSEPVCVAEGAGAEVLGVGAALVELRNEELPGAVEAVVFPNKEAGLVEGAISAGLDGTCDPKSERPPVLPMEPVFSMPAGFVLNVDGGSTGFVVGKRDGPGF